MGDGLDDLGGGWISVFVDAVVVVGSVLVVSFFGWISTPSNFSADCAR